MVLLLALLVIGGVVWAVIAQPWRLIADMLSQPDPSPTPSAPLETGEPTSSPTGSETPTPTPSETEDPGPKPCDPNAVEIQALTDKDVYGADEHPQLSIRLTNTGDVDCTFNVGTTQQVFTITSGSDTWWRSTDCQREPVDMVVTLAAGQEVTSAEPLVWDRTRSSVDTCDDENRPVAPGGGSSYHLAVSIGGIDAESTKQFILN